MRESDWKRFAEVLSGVLDIYGKERSDSSIALWVRMLDRYELSEVEPALAEHLRTSRFAPTPADIIAILATHDGRPTADEAWSMIPRDEYASVIWTDEMSQAYAVAAPLLVAGDAIAARRAFIDRYTSAVESARRSGVLIKTWPSWGWDANGRQGAVDKALALGLIDHKKASYLLGFVPDQRPPALELPKLKSLGDEVDAI